ncbi:MmgE/PrpD family protein [Candidatus Entotheonella palauensis]|uniref:MmgE/PrpD family protein n=1 Tax=Candidatus Entotheonella palauensis TaxID=93172 RepID=UPI000B7C7342|nr:MmgE/PrpD family protein [Candidatus Entotheonella palauensis]
MTQAVERLTAHVMATDFENLSPEAVIATKTFCLDTLGVSVAGTSAPHADEMRITAAGWGDGQEATALGMGNRLNAPTAAMINAFHAHSLEFDCVHELAVVHPLTTIQSAALAYAERGGGVAGRDLLTALALGVDVATSIGMASQSSLRFFRPATAGIFGATAAVGKLARLSESQLMDALGLAYTQAAGTMQSHVEGGPALALQMAFAAAAAIRAVDLAQAGFPGPHDILEGPFGYFPLYEGTWELEPVWAELGDLWRITQVSHKPFPSGRATHGGLDGILQLRQAHALSPDAVEHVTLLAPSLIHELVGRPLQVVMSANYARLCFQFVGALALANGDVRIDDFTDGGLTDAHIHELARRIEVVIDDNPDPNALAPQTVVIRLRDGGEHRIDVPHTLGSPERPLTRAQHLEKFRRCLQSGAAELPSDAADRLIALVDNLDTLDNTNELIIPLCPVTA